MNYLKPISTKTYGIIKGDEYLWTLKYGGFGAFSLTEPLFPIGWHIFTVYLLLYRYHKL
jgi:hypothetical protein